MSACKLICIVAQSRQECSYRLCAYALCIDNIYLDYFKFSAADIIHPPDPFHLVVGFQRFGNTICICHLLYQPRKKFLCPSVDIRKIGVQFATCQQSGISHTAMLLEIAEMPLSPYPDWLIFLRLIIPGNQIIVSNQFLLQPGAFICDKALHPYNLPSCSFLQPL